MTPPDPNVDVGLGSELFKLLAAHTSLTGLTLDPKLDSYNKEASLVLESASHIYYDRTVEFLAVPEAEMGAGSISEFDRLAGEAVARAFVDNGAFLCAYHDEHSAKLVSLMRSELDKSGVREEVGRSEWVKEVVSRFELRVARWERQRGNENSHKQLKRSARSHAELILAFLELGQTLRVVRTPEDRQFSNALRSASFKTYTAAIEGIIIASRNLPLPQSAHSLGAAHVFNFGSHAISQRTATRYNII